MIDTTIGPATGQDAEWCARLMASSDPWITLGRGFEECLARCQAADNDLLVARRNAQPCGFVLMHPRGVAGSPYIASIAAAAAERGQGVGTELLAFAEQHYPSARHIFLCCSSFNPRARAFYEHRGYRMVGELPDYIIDGASEFLLHKRLVRR